MEAVGTKPEVGTRCGTPCTVKETLRVGRKQIGKRRYARRLFVNPSMYTAIRTVPAAFVSAVGLITYVRFAPTSWAPEWQRHTETKTASSPKKAQPVHRSLNDAGQWRVHCTSRVWRKRRHFCFFCIRKHAMTGKAMAPTTIPSIPAAAKGSRSL